MLSKELSGGSFCRTVALSAAATFSCFDGKLRFSGLLRGWVIEGAVDVFRGRSLFWVPGAGNGPNSGRRHLVATYGEIVHDVWCCRKLSCSCRIAPL